MVRSTLGQSNLSEKEVQDIIRSFGIVSANVVRRSDATDDHIVDTLAGNRIYSRAVVVINKVDLATESDMEKAESMVPDNWSILRVSAKTGEGSRDEGFHL